MPSLSLSTDKAQALGRLLQSRGYDAADFEVATESDSLLSSLFVQVGKVLRVRRRSTGEERLYAGGVDSRWVDSLLTDLSRGHLAGESDSRPAVLEGEPDDVWR